MDEKDLLIERLRREVERKDEELACKHNELQQSEAVRLQLEERVQEKDHKVAALEHQIKLLLQRIRDSRQERINPDQLMLFSVEELQQLADELDKGDPEEDLLEQDNGTAKKRRRPRGRRGKLPSHLPRKLIRHELDQQDRACPCCGEQRHEIGTESS